MGTLKLFKSTLVIYGSKPKDIGVTHQLSARGFLNILSRYMLDDSSEMYIPGIGGPFSKEEGGFFEDSYIGQDINLRFFSKTHINTIGLVSNFKEYPWLITPPYDNLESALKERPNDEMYCSVNVDFQSTDKSKIESFKRGLEVKLVTEDRIYFPFYF